MTWNPFRANRQFERLLDMGRKPLRVTPMPLEVDFAVSFIDGKVTVYKTGRMECTCPNFKRVTEQGMICSHIAEVQLQQNERLMKSPGDLYRDIYGEDPPASMTGSEPLREAPEDRGPVESGAKFLPGVRFGQRKIRKDE